MKQKVDSLWIVRNHIDRKQLMMYLEGTICTVVQGPEAEYEYLPNNNCFERSEYLLCVVILV